MHSLLNQQMAKQHMQELQHEATVARLVDSADVHLARKTRFRSTHRVLWYLLLGQHIPTYKDYQVSLKQETTLDWSQDRVNATIRMVGFATLGLGSLIGGYLSTKFGPFPAVLLSGITFFVLSLPILKRSVTMLKEYLFHLPHRW